MALADLYRLSKRRAQAIELLNAPDAIQTQGEGGLRSRLMLARLLIENAEADKALKLLDGSAVDSPPWAEWPFAYFESLWKNAAKIGRSRWRCG